jgi:hypothetical protein
MQCVFLSSAHYISWRTENQAFEIAKLICVFACLANLKPVCPFKRMGLFFVPVEDTPKIIF